LVRSTRIARTGSPRRALTQLAGSHATGALHIGTGDRLYLVSGEVVFAESPAAPGVGDLLVASGRLASQTWEAAMATADVRPGAWLVEQGHLTQGELELCVLGAIYDAAYFALGSATATLRFAEGESHGLGGVTAVDAAVLAKECARRRKLLDEIHPDAALDAAPVVPLRRAPVPRVVLSDLQWEIVAQADGRLSATGLARQLGRAGYAVLTEVRRLAAAGLVAPAAPGAADGAPATVGRAAMSTPRPPDGAPPIRAAVPAPAPRGALPALPRRAPGERLPELAASPAAAPAPTAPPVPADEALLKRIRTALKALR